MIATKAQRLDRKPSKYWRCFQDFLHRGKYLFSPQPHPLFHYCLEFFFLGPPGAPPFMTDASHTLRDSSLCWSRMMSYRWAALFDFWFLWKQKIHVPCFIKKKKSGAAERERAARPSERSEFGTFCFWPSKGKKCKVAATRATAHCSTRCYCLELIASSSYFDCALRLCEDEIRMIIDHKS